MSQPEVIVDKASPCPRCGGRSLLAVVYFSSPYTQEIAVEEDGRLAAAHEAVREYDEPSGDVLLRCLACHHWWEM